MTTLETDIRLMFLNAVDTVDRN